MSQTPKCKTMFFIFIVLLKHLTNRIFLEVILGFEVKKLGKVLITLVTVYKSNHS